MKNKALVLFSGGQDSTTCLYWAKEKFGSVETLSFNYGQRHQIEIESTKKIIRLIGVEHTILNVNVLKQIADSALVNNINNINENHRSSDNLPASFVPGRNILLLTIAAMFAFKKGIKNIVTGVCQIDYSGYPDCRDDTIKSLQVSLNLGMGYDFIIHTPLMRLNKKETVLLAKELLGCWEALSYSHTCYRGQYPPCEKCPACKIRTKGFEEAGCIDPLKQRDIYE